MSRRKFFRVVAILLGQSMFSQRISFSKNLSKKNKKVLKDSFSHIYVGIGGSPEENTQKVLKLMGGIGRIINKDDIVILKPNSQWWNQGMTNTNSMKEFVRQVLNLPNFMGEIIIADNHQFQQDESRGWTTGTPNGDYNLNQLIQYFNDLGYKNVTKYHWHCGGPNKGLVQGNGHGDRVVNAAQDGDGYVWRDDMVYEVENGRKTMMTYPIFTSSYSRITIDLKNGAWKDGKYLKNKVKLINFPSLNHHSNWAGVTSCIKNYLGIVDMSCGYHGETPKKFYNFHYVGNYESKVNRYVEKLCRMAGIGYFEHFHGGPVGYFMKNVRMADLNVVTAHCVGFGSRTDKKLSARPKAVLASTDPVALDYYAAKYFLLRFTPKKLASKWGYNFYKYNDPDYIKGPFRRQLEECHAEGIGNLDEARMKIHGFALTR